MTSTAKDKTKPTRSNLTWIGGGIILAMYFNGVTLKSLQYAIPYLLLYSPFRDATLQYWQKFAVVNKDIVYPSIPIPEIHADVYTYDNLREATSNFKYPAVVRGLFNGTNALKYWATRDYLPNSVLGKQVIPVVRNAYVGTLQDDRELETFSDSYYAMYDSVNTKEYLFFPVKSRFTFNGSAAGAAALLDDAVNTVIQKDLELDRIWPGFSSKRHTAYKGGQFVIGKSVDDINSKNATGSDWHCAPGNNWFIQVAGRKRWYFIDPKHTHFLWPLKGGLLNMWTGHKDMESVQKHIPTSFVDLYPGDMVYNPDWSWHKIRNYGGLSIGIPLREGNMSLAIQNNKFFTSITVTTRILGKFGLTLGGFPPISAKTEQDN